MKEYNINITSKLTGLSLHTLRAWEKRYSIVTPKRNSSGHRLYNDKEVEILIRLNLLCTHGHNISNLIGKSLSELNDLLEKSGINDNKKNELVIDDDPVNAQKSLKNLLLALEAYRLDVVSHEFYNIKMKLSLRDLALNVVSPLLSTVGNKVSEGTFTISQEHALSSIIKFHLGQFLYSKSRQRKKIGKLFIISTPEGDYHEFGILLAGLLCVHHGCNFFYLGPNMPAEALIQAADSLDADNIIMGTTNFNSAISSHHLDDYFSKILKGIGNKRKLIVGGSGFFDFSKIKNKKKFEYSPTLNHLEKYLTSSEN
ncbi:MAG: MerR family transcriptional regulator [Bacteriovoracaceae bacterium]|nr:MerR family transcriptional regulator [Bacteriovoracaceae bacterium]